jgi:hypothetical protein
VRRCRRKKHAKKEEEGDEGNIIEGDWGQQTEEEE